MPVDDRAAIASGDPPGFAEAATFAVTALDRLSRGGVTLDGLKLDVAGEAKSVDDYEAVLASLGGALPEGMRVVDTEITPATVSPYFWKAERAGGRVVLTGYVPSPQNRQEMMTLAQALFAERCDRPACAGGGGRAAHGLAGRHQVRARPARAS